MAHWQITVEIEGMAWGGFKSRYTSTTGRMATREELDAKVAELTAPGAYPKIKALFGDFESLSKITMRGHMERFEITEGGIHRAIQEGWTIPVSMKRLKAPQEAHA